MPPSYKIRATITAEHDTSCSYSREGVVTFDDLKSAALVRDGVWHTLHEVGLGDMVDITVIDVDGDVVIDADGARIEPYELIIAGPHGGEVRIMINYNLEAVMSSAGIFFKEIRCWSNDVEVRIERGGKGWLWPDHPSVDIRI